MMEEDDEETLFDQDTLLSSGNKPSSDWSRRFTKTVVLSIAFFALGLCMAIPGPTLLDLGDRVGASTEKMSYIFPARSVGYLAGSVIGGFLFDHFDQQILLFYTLFVTSVATTLAPWCTSLVVLAIMMSFQGLSMGVLDTGGNIFCMKIWGRKSAPYMQVVHFSFAVGAFIAPLLARPFLITPGNMTSSIVGLNTSDGHNLFARDVIPFNSTLNMTFVFIPESNLINASSTSISPKTVYKPKVLTSKDKTGDFADGDKVLESIQDGGDTEVKVAWNLSSLVHVTNVTPTHLTNVTPTHLTPNGTPTHLTNVTPTHLTPNGTVVSMNAATIQVTTVRTSTTVTVPTKLTSTTPTKPSTTMESNPSTTLPSKPSSTLATKTSRTTKASSTMLPKASTTKANVSGTAKKPQTIGDIVNTAIASITHMSKIQFAYLIIGVLLVCNSLMFATLYYKDRHRTSVFCPENKRPSLRGNASHRYTILFILFIFFFLYVGMEVTFGGLILTFSVQHMHWNKSTSAVLTAVFWGALATGRGLAIFIARCFKPPCMLVVDLILVIIGAAVLSCGLPYMEELLWVGTFILGLGMSSVFPSGISWADQYFSLTGRSTAVLISGSALGEMLIPVLTSSLYDNYSRMSLMYVVLTLSLLLMLVYLAMQCLASKTIPASRFLPVQDDCVPMDSFDEMSLLDSSRKRTVHPKPANMEVEYSRLIDVDS